MSEINDSLLTELIRQNSFIYDKKEPLFKDKAAKKNVWQSIGDILNKKGSECEQRWSVLRTRYNTERRDLAKPSGSAAGYKRKWPLFEALGFLDQHLIKKKTKGNVEMVEKYAEEMRGDAEDSEVLDEYVGHLLQIKIPQTEENIHAASDIELFSPVSTQSSSCSQIAVTSSMRELRKENIGNKRKNLM